MDIVEELYHSLKGIPHKNPLSASLLSRAAEEISKLRRELDHYQADEAYARGQKDYLYNDGRENPYREGTESFALWNSGNITARTQDIRKTISEVVLGYRNGK